MKKEFYSTHDLNLTSTLVALGHPIYEIKKGLSSRAKFVFLRTSILNKDISNYWNQDLKVNPHSIFNALSFIKSRIYDGDLG